MTVVHSEHGNAAPTASLQDPSPDGGLGVDRESRMLALRTQMEQRFRDLAEGRAWFEGIFPHQWGAVCYGGAARRWFLGDEPGAGKTRSSIGWLDIVGAKRVVLVAEANVCAQFAGEISDLAPHRTILNLAKLEKETRHERLLQMSKLDQAVVVLNYEMFHRDQDALGKVLIWQPDTLIIDEAHNMKNSKSQTYKNMEKIAFANNTCPECDGLIFGVSEPCQRCGWSIRDLGYHRKDGVIGPEAVEKWFRDIYKAKDRQRFFMTKSVKNILPMTGTPLLNTPEDLWCIFHLIRPIEFPSLTDFKKQYTHPDYSANRSAFSKKGLDLMLPKISGAYLARTLSEVGIELPKQHLHVERVEIDPEVYPLQARTIEQVSKYAALMLSTGETHTIMHMISIILRKRQANVWPGGIEIKDPNTGEVMWSVGQEVKESAKMDAALERVLEYHKLGQRQVVFSQFRTALVEFERRLTAAGLRVARMDGTTPESKRTAIKSNFYKAKGEEPKWDVVVVHYKTGGAGLNLTAATVTHILDEEWNAGKRDQAYARTHRMGQDEETNVHIYRAPGVDVWMANLIAMKERMVNKLGQAMSSEKQVSMIVEAIQKGEI